MSHPLVARKSNRSVLSAVELFLLYSKGLAPSSFEKENGLSNALLLTKEVSNGRRWARRKIESKADEV